MRRPNEGISIPEVEELGLTVYGPKQWNALGQEVRETPIPFTKADLETARDHNLALVFHEMSYRAKGMVDQQSLQASQGDPSNRLIYSTFERGDERNYRSYWSLMSLQSLPGTTNSSILDGAEAVAQYLETYFQTDLPENLRRGIEDFREKAASLLGKRNLIRNNREILLSMMESFTQGLIGDINAARHDTGDTTRSAQNVNAVMHDSCSPTNILKNMGVIPSTLFLDSGLFRLSQPNLREIISFLLLARVKHQRVLEGGVRVPVDLHTNEYYGIPHEKRMGDDRYAVYDYCLRKPDQVIYVYPNDEGNPVIRLDAEGKSEFGFPLSLKSIPR